MNRYSLQILLMLKIAAWFVFLFFVLKAMQLIITFVGGIANLQIGLGIYNDSSFFSLRSDSILHYTIIGLLLIFISMFKVYVWHLVIRALSKVDFTNPLKLKMARSLEKIAFTFFIIWMMGITINIYSNWLIDQFGPVLSSRITLEEYMILAGLIFIISQLIKQHNKIGAAQV